MAASADILRFWFEEVQPAQWWKVDLEFDALIRSRFGALHEAAVAGELLGWRSEAAGWLV